MIGKVEYIDFLARYKIFEIEDYSGSMDLWEDENVLDITVIGNIYEHPELLKEE